MRAPAPPGAFASAAAVQAQGREVSQLQLFSAAAAGDLSSLEAALGSGATVGAANVDGATSLHVAVEAGHEATVGRLLEANPDAFESLGQAWEFLGRLQYHRDDLEGAAASYQTAADSLQKVSLHCYC